MIATHPARLVLVLLAVTCPQRAFSQTFATTDPTGDHVLCRDGSAVESNRASIDIISFTMGRDQAYTIFTIATDAPIDGSEILAGGIEALNPLGPEPFYYQDWLFNNTGNMSWNFSANTNAVATGFSRVGQDRIWSQGTSNFMVTRDGNEFTIMIPNVEIPSGALFMATMTDFFINENPHCDEVGLADHGYAGIGLPGQVAGTDVFPFNGNTPIDYPAPGLLANDAAGCGQPTVPTFTNESGTLAGGQDGSLSYEPRPGVGNVDGFTYTVVCDGQTTNGQVSLRSKNSIWYFDSEADQGGDGYYNNPFSSWDDLVNLVDNHLVHPRDAIYLAGGVYDGTISLPNGVTVMGAGSTADLPSRGFNLAPFSRTVSTPVENAATLTSQGGFSFLIPPDYSLKVYDLNVVVEPDATGFRGRDYGVLTLDNIAFAGGGTAMDLNGGGLDADIASIDMDNVVTRTISIHNVDGRLDVTGPVDISGSSQFPVYQIERSEAFSATHGQVVTIRNDAGGGLYWRDIGYGSIPDGSIVTGGGQALNLENTVVDFNLQEIEATTIVSHTSSFREVAGNVQVTDWNASTEGQEFAIYIDGGTANYQVGRLEISTGDGGGLYANFAGAMAIQNSRIQGNEGPAIDVTGPQIDWPLVEIKASTQISRTIRLQNTQGTAVFENTEIQSDSEAPVIYIDQHTGLIIFNNASVSNSVGDGIFVDNPTGSVQINNSIIEVNGRGVYLPVILKDAAEKTSSPSSQPDIAFIVENSRITAATGYAIEVDSNDPRELTLAIEGDTLIGAEGEIAIRAQEGSNVTLANFPGGDADAVALFLQEANEGDPRVVVEGEIGQGENVTAVEPVGDELPKSIGLAQNYPNPFNPTTTIQFDVPESGFAELAVYNLFGQRVTTLHAGELAAGSFSVTWNGRANSGIPVASGTYLYRLTAAGQIVTRTMTLVQ